MRCCTTFQVLVAVNGVLAERVCNDGSTRESSDVKSLFGKSGYLNLPGKFAVKVRVKMLCKFGSLYYY